MADAGDIIDVIKRAAVSAVDEKQPSKYVFGTVTQVKPLKIKISDKIILTKEFLTLTRNVTAYTTSAKLGNEGFKSLTVSNNLVVGEKVVLIKNAEATGYLVLDRVVKAT